MYGKATENAIAALSRLAEVYDEGQTLLSANDIAEHRGLQKPYVSKLLSALSQAGLVRAQRGPGGGFTLARHPGEITLHDVWVLFERESGSDKCPFGGGYCGGDTPCALHQKLVETKAAIDEMLRETTLAGFLRAHAGKGGKRGSGSKGPRRSYRAPRGR